MAQIIWTDPALEDLNEIAEYIALDKPSAAKWLVREVFSKVKRLEDFPNSGRKPPELDKTRYRELIIPPCRVFYRIEEGKVFILYVMRSERKLRKFILEAR
jgi:toxin ParE1/3/4